jgi:hypothetical protein
MVFGNFGVKVKTGTVTFPSTGKWYSFLGTGTLTIASTAYPVTLQPGEYYVYTNQDVKGEVLAVNWLSFSVQKQGAYAVLLNWSTQNEVNNDRFEIERSSDGISFTKTGSVKAMQTNGTKQYSFTDNLPLNGTNYYRIKQVDKDGSYQYSSIQKIDLAAIAKRWSLFPNPAKNNTTLFALNNYNKATIAVHDLNGKIVYQSTINKIVAGQQLTIPLQRLTKGVYVVKIITDDDVDTQKLVVQ